MTLLRPSVGNVRTWVVGAAVVALGGVAAVASPALRDGKLAEALEHLSAATPGWLWLGAVAFAASLVCMGGAWRAGLRSCGAAGVGVGDASARYASGSLVNALAPAGCGGAVRLALFSRVLPGQDRIWRTGGVAAVVAAARSLALAPVVVGGAVLTGLALTPALVLAGAVLVAVGVALVARHRTPRHRVAHVLDAFRALGNAPGDAARVAGWVSLALGVRIGAAACVAAAVGVGPPPRAALVAVPALALANVFPLTPGNVGVATGAVALALVAVGVDTGTAIAVGIGIHALETLVGIGAGVVAAVYLAPLPLPAWSLRLGAAVGCLGLAGGFGATVLV